MVMTEHLLQPAASALSEVASNLLLIMSQIITSWEGAILVAIIVFVTLLTEAGQVHKATRQV